jgi:hypothetical protein
MIEVELFKGRNMERLTITLEPGIDEKEAVEVLDIVRRIKARSFAKGFSSRCPQCGEIKGECKDEGERPVE